MPKFRVRHAFVAVLLLVSMLAQGTWALAGTTGGISGQVRDAVTGVAVANATVTANSSSGSATATTDAGGNFHFLTLSPDTYTISATKSGYNSASQSGVTVFADQTATLTLNIQPALKTIANVTSRAAGNLVKPGTTSDVYSVNAATQQVVSGTGGGFNLNQAYSGIYSQPGVTSYVGNAGWGQVFYIRGSAYSQIGYEFDGVPVNRAFDNYQANSLSTLGQQELQVYTGGSPSGASSPTLGGFINQVIKTGTYPGFGNLMGGIGSPGFYHALTAEAGGANPNRTFSYYVGLQGYNQSYPNLTWNNGAGLEQNGLGPNGLQANGFYGTPEIATVYGGLEGWINGAPPDGGAWAFQWTNGPWPACQNNPTPGSNGGVAVGYTAANPGPFNGTCLGYGPYGTSFLANEFERDTVVNLHFALPHRNDSGRDDLQLLYDNSMQYQTYGNSLNDIGGMAFISGYMQPYSQYASAPWAGTNIAGLCGYENFFSFGCAQTNSPVPYSDSYIFAPGTSFGQNATTAVVTPYYFPNSPTNRQLNDFRTVGTPSGISPNLRDGTFNDVGIIKGQYTKNIGSNAYARVFGYTFYSDWLISSPAGTPDCYLGGGMYSSVWGQCTPDYELATHTRGGEFQFADQINSQNLLRFTANYTTAGVTRMNNTGILSNFSSSREVVTNLTNGSATNPMCFNYKTGAQGSCFSLTTAGVYSSGSGGPTRGEAFNPCGTTFTPATTPAAYGAKGACTNGATWQVTVPGGQGTYNTVRPVFTSMALEDEFKPNDRLDLNLGLRFEQYQYNLQNVNNPEFNFWFNEAAQVNCYDPGTGQPMLTPLGPGQPVPPQPHQTAPLAACGTAASGQEGLHPTGGTAPCTTTGGVDCGPLLYTASVVPSYTRRLLSPRIGGTYTMGADDVLRFSAGKYTQPTETAFEQYVDLSGKRAAAFDFSQFWGLGFNSPGHDNPVQYSNNYDFSFEHRFRNTDISLKVSPFYRDTHNQIETVVLGPGFVGGVNVGHQHSWGVELGIQKGDPSRDGWAGALSYTYTRALVQYGNLPNGRNAIDNLNDYVKAFNALTQGGGGSPCYDTSTTPATPMACPASFSGTPTVIKNPYYSMSQQSLLDRQGWYQTYPNESPNSPFDQGGSSAIWPHQFTGWLQYKHGRFAIAPNFQLVSGSYYGSPVDVLGVDPRSCGQNEAAALGPTGAPVLPAGSAQAGYCDFLTSASSPYVNTGQLAIPNPYTGKMDSVGQFQQPWILNVGALLRYDISPKISASLTLANIFNTCYGGNGNAWQAKFPANRWVCGYSSNAANFIGTQPGTGFFYGASGSDPANGTTPYATAFNYPFYPVSGAIPLQAYLQLQIRL
ncbi:MAG TPA: TonB-dependent receptor [Candidatus Rubrimentiphilum sp.]|nr:TonB-dependent receptor [Candidatus Rubrimentiphilum sp.]